MCLGAIYWARLDRIYYAASREDAAAAGFDDSKIYQEVAAPIGRRAIPMVNLMREEGGEPMQIWKSFGEKITY